ncbi:hypothetical protein ACLOJK_035194, partial [Asimina triloba]
MRTRNCLRIAAGADPCYPDFHIAGFGDQSGHILCLLFVRWVPCWTDERRMGERPKMLLIRWATGWVLVRCCRRIEEKKMGRWGKFGPSPAGGSLAMAHAARSFDGFFLVANLHGRLVLAGCVVRCWRFRTVAAGFWMGSGWLGADVVRSRLVGHRCCSIVAGRIWHGRFAGFQIQSWVAYGQQGKKQSTSFMEIAARSLMLAGRSAMKMGPNFGAACCDPPLQMDWSCWLWAAMEAPWGDGGAPYYGGIAWIALALRGSTLMPRCRTTKLRNLPVETLNAHFSGFIFRSYLQRTNDQIVDVAFHGPVEHVVEDGLHGPLVSCPGVLESEWHEFVTKAAHGGSKGSCCFVCRAIREGERVVQCRAVDKELRKGEWKLILWACLIE